MPALRLRRRGLTLGSPTGSLSVAHDFDPAGRLQTVAAGTYSARYSYLANSPLVDTVSFKQGTVTVMTTTRTYDNLNRLSSVHSAGSGSTPPLAFAYGYNDANQRVRATLADGWVEQDDDGNLTEDGRWRFTWGLPREIGNRETGNWRNWVCGFRGHAGVEVASSHGSWENRLVRIEPATAVGPQLTLTFTYDALSRRIRKTVTGGSSAVDQRFAYDGWNLVAILSSDLRPVSSFVWGLDLSGSDQGAGGVGGLLAVKGS